MTEFVEFIEFLEFLACFPSLKLNELQGLYEHNELSYSQP